MNNITRRQFTASALAASFAAASGSAAVNKGTAEIADVRKAFKSTKGKYNIVIIKTDQQRGDTINCLGNKHMITPNLDKFASDSVVFSNAFCCGATCVVSRAAFYTGRFAINTGIYTFQNWADQPTWLDDIREAGYYLTAVGKNHHMPFDAPMAYHERLIVENFPLYESWDDFSNYLEENNQPRPLKMLTEDGKWMEKCGSDVYPLEEKYYADNYVGTKAVEWINKYEKDEPFFLHIGFQGPHDPFTVPERFLRMYDDVDVPKPVDADGGENKPPQYERFRRTVADPLRGFDTPPIYGSCYIDLEGKSEEDITRMRKHYYAKVTAIDEQLGFIMDALEQKGVLDNTIVVFTSDHGENLADHKLVYKWLMTDQATNVPMMVMLPKKLRRTDVDDRLFTQIDVGPTLLDLCRIKPTVKLDGKSNKNRLISGSDENVPDTVYCFKQYLTMARTETEKVINYAGQPYGEYYNLAADPTESKNLYDTEKTKTNKIEAKMYDYFSSLRFLGTEQLFSKSINDPKPKSKLRLYPQIYVKDPYRLH
ncbi:MAG: sulfatase [Sedimentisphaeraceae bacterium JB056]